MLPKASKAASVGANTVKGCVPFRSSDRPALLSAPSRVVKLPFASIVSNHFLLGAAYGPTFRFNPDIATAALRRAATATTVIPTMFLFIQIPRPSLKGGNTCH